MIHIITFGIENTSRKCRYNSLRVKRLDSETISLGSSFGTCSQSPEFFLNSYLAKKQYSKRESASYRSWLLDIIPDAIKNYLNKFILYLDSRLMLRSLLVENLSFNVQEVSIAVVSMTDKDSNWASQRYLNQFKVAKNSLLPMFALDAILVNSMYKNCFLS